MTFACLALDKGEQGSVALVMTTGKHILIPKSAPIHSTSKALRGAVHTVSSSEKKFRQEQCPQFHLQHRAPCGLWRLSQQTLECRHCLATYYYLISNIFPRDQYPACYFNCTSLSCNGSVTFGWLKTCLCAHAPQTLTHTQHPLHLSFQGTCDKLQPAILTRAAHDTPTPPSQFLFSTFYYKLLLEMKYTVLQGKRKNLHALATFFLVASGNILTLTKNV